MGSLGAALEVVGQTSAMRTVGVEEELLLVDVHTGRPRSVASQVIAATDEHSAREVGGGGVEDEFQRYMVETQSSVASELADVEEELRRWRRVVANAAGKPAPASQPSPPPRWRVPA